MTKAILICCALLALGACRGGGGNAAANAAANLAEEGFDANMAVGGDEIAPIPEAEDDMIANNSSAASSINAAAAPPAPEPRRR